jgi:Do/DeqQ family serine protease
MWLPWVLLIVVIGVFAMLQRQWQNKPETAVLNQQRPLVVTSAANTVASYHAAVQVASPAVVNIYTTQKVSGHPSLNDPSMRRFFEFHGQMIPEEAPEPEDSTNLGSGVIVSSQGYILTNNHVIADADGIVIALQDGQRIDAKVVGTDPESDLAVLKIERTGLPVLPFKKTASLVGDVVLAIGNPFGVGQTVTQGIISATGRSGLGINTYEDFIQTDAAINPGNSGGALIDVAGNLVGINTAIFSRSGGSMGIGFAIPVDLAQQVMTEIIQSGRVTRGWLGIEVGPDQPASEQAIVGVLVVAVQKNGPADMADLRRNDRILAINQQPLRTAAQLIQLVGQQKPGATIQLQVQRDAQQLNLPVLIKERPSSSERREQTPAQQQEWDDAWSFGR